MLLVLAAAKQVGLRCSQGFARSTGGVRQPGRLVSGGYPGIGLRRRLGPEGLGKPLLGLQHVHWCEGSCCWFLRLQSRLV